MSRKEQKKLEKSANAQAAREAGAKGKVLMRFTEHKYYTDLNNPIYCAGKIYELEGQDWINRWIKRGGEIVESTEEKVEKAKPEAAPVDGLVFPTGVVPEIQVPDTSENQVIASSGGESAPDKEIPIFGDEE